MVLKIHLGPNPDCVAYILLAAILVAVLGKGGGAIPQLVISRKPRHYPIKRPPRMVIVRDKSLQIFLVVRELVVNRTTNGVRQRGQQNALSVRG
jgi:hypothetical protein